MSKNFRCTLMITAAMATGTLAAPALAAGGPGGGGGGTATPPPPVNIGNQLVESPSTIVGVDAGNTYTFGNTASFKDAAPTITLTTAPAGVSIANVSTFPPAKGGPWTTSVTTNPWTPTRDQIGQQTVTFTATAGGQTTATNIQVTVFDAPSPVTNLVATTQGGQINVNWQGAQFGVGPITYQVLACIFEPNQSPGGIRPGGLSGETCFGLPPWTNTTSTSVTIPSTLAFPLTQAQSTPNPILPVNKIIVTPFGADGIAGGQAFIVPSS
jgi:hypothetical protein